MIIIIIRAFKKRQQNANPNVIHKQRFVFLSSYFRCHFKRDQPDSFQRRVRF